MDKIEKALKKLSDREREVLKKILLASQSGQLSNLDVKKLKDRDDIYRVRKRDLRVIFIKTGDGDFKILAIERRSNITYRRY